jgi:hypothetical protein
MDSYNSKYPIEYYEIGTPYKFYGNAFSVGKPATHDQISKYKCIFDSLEKNKTENIVNKQNNNSGNKMKSLIRFVGVVVEKQRKATGSTICVMYKNYNNGIYEYRINHYIVASKEGSLTDDKDWAETSSLASFNTLSSDSAKPSGIKKAAHENRVSGITGKVHTENRGTGAVSGITAIKESKSRVSGITAVKK